jgi:hypothetical protein
MNDAITIRRACETFGDRDVGDGWRREAASRDHGRD